MEAPGAVLAAGLEERVSRLWWLISRDAPTVLSRSAAATLARLREDGPQRISALAHGESVAQPSMTQLVQRLERDAYVTRQAGPGRRARHADRDHRRRPPRAGGPRGRPRRGPRRRGSSALSARERAAIAKALPALDALPGRLMDRLRHQPAAVWAVLLACVVAFMGIGLVDPILPIIAKGLHATPVARSSCCSPRTSRSSASPTCSRASPPRASAPRTPCWSAWSSWSSAPPRRARPSSVGDRRRLPRRLGPGHRAVHLDLDDDDRRPGPRRRPRRGDPVRVRARRRHRLAARWSAACSAGSAGGSRSSASPC